MDSPASDQRDPNNIEFLMDECYYLGVLDAVEMVGEEISFFLSRLERLNHDGVLHESDYLVIRIPLAMLYPGRYLWYMNRPVFRCQWFGVGHVDFFSGVDLILLAAACGLFDAPTSTEQKGEPYG